MLVVLVVELIIRAEGCQGFQGGVYLKKQRREKELRAGVRMRAAMGVAVTAWYSSGHSGHVPWYQVMVRQDPYACRWDNFNG